MRAVMAYRMSRGGNSNEMRRGGNQNNYGEARGNQDAYNEMRGGGGNRSEYGEMRGGYSEMRQGGGNRIEYGEMRRGGNRSAYDEMGEDYGGAESRYRGRDGRWKAGRRRSEMDGGMDEDWPEDARAYDARNEYQPKPNNYGRVESRYKPEYPIAPMDEGGMAQGRRIGFGNQDRSYGARNHYSEEGGEGESKGQMVRAGGTFWMENPEGEKLDKQTMEKWVHSMKDDKGKPIEPWSPEEIKPLASRFGYPSSGEKFDTFYTAIHMMKSDFCAVAEEFDVNVPAFYAALADTWLRDPDAAMQYREKLEAYYKHIVKGKK